MLPVQLKGCIHTLKLMHLYAYGPACMQGKAQLPADSSSPLHNPAPTPGVCVQLHCIGNHCRPGHVRPAAALESGRCAGARGEHLELLVRDAAKMICNKLCGRVELWPA